MADIQIKNANGQSVLYEGVNKIKVAGRYAGTTEEFKKPALQSKSATITENGSHTYIPDNGYDGLSSMVVTVNAGNASYYTEIFTAGSVTIPDEQAALLTYDAFFVTGTGGALVDRTAIGGSVSRLPLTSMTTSASSTTLIFSSSDSSKNYLAFVTAVMNDNGDGTSTITVTYAEENGVDITSGISLIGITLYLFTQLN